MTPSWRHPFLQFPDNHVRSAFRQALEEGAADIVCRAHEICWRWQQNPLAPDCPPAYGHIAIPAREPSETSSRPAPMPSIRSLLATSKIPAIRRAYNERGLPEK